jgi:hypothetical protein
MNWKNWKIGLLVATLIGFFTACGAAAVLDVVINWKFAFFFLSLIGKDVILFLANNPADKISFDTSTIKRTESDGSSVEATIRKTTTPTDPPKP